MHSTSGVNGINFTTILEFCHLFWPTVKVQLTIKKKYFNIAISDNFILTSGRSHHQDFGTHFLV